MPFYGVLPRRRHIFAEVEPYRAIGVSDAEAWRLNPRHRWVYNKLELAVTQGVTAAPTGVPPARYGFAPETTVFLKPITNLFGLSKGARPVPAEAIPEEPGYFWSELLTGEQTSTDVMVQSGRAVWFAHTSASPQRVDTRPVYWRIGGSAPTVEAQLTEWIAANLPDYTGITNFELLQGYVIEAHLRGSNAFIEFYGPGWVRDWARLVDTGRWAERGPPPGGYVFSCFTDASGPVAQDTALQARLAADGIQLEWDLTDAGAPHGGRIAILRVSDEAQGWSALERLGEALNIPVKRGEAGDP